MEYAEILSDTQALIGDGAEGSSRYSSDQYAAALQWAQEQAADVLGLTYQETNVVTSASTGPWGETLTTVGIPTDAIKVTRCEIGTSPLD